MRWAALQRNCTGWIITIFRVQYCTTSGAFTGRATRLARLAHAKAVIAVRGPKAHGKGALRGASDAGRGRERTRRGSYCARTGAGAVPGPELPLSVAGRPAGLLGLRDGRRDPGLVRAGVDRLGPGAGHFRLPAVPR